MEWLTTIATAVVGAAIAVLVQRLTARHANALELTNERRRELRILAARLIKETDAAFVADSAVCRAVYALRNAEQGGNKAIIQSVNEQWAKALAEYIPANDAARQLALELRIEYPELEESAAELWRQAVANKVDMGLTQESAAFKVAQDAFIEAVRISLSASR